MQILDTRMGFRCPSLNVVLDSISLQEGNFSYERVTTKCVQMDNESKWLSLVSYISNSRALIIRYTLQKQGPN